MCHSLKSIITLQSFFTSSLKNGFNPGNKGDILQLQAEKTDQMF